MTFPDAAIAFFRGLQPFSNVLYLRQYQKHKGVLQVPSKPGGNLIKGQIGDMVYMYSNTGVALTKVPILDTTKDTVAVELKNGNIAIFTRIDGRQTNPNNENYPAFIDEDPERYMEARAHIVTKRRETIKAKQDGTYVPKKSKPANPKTAKIPGRYKNFDPADYKPLQTSPDYLDFMDDDDY